MTRSLEAIKAAFATVVGIAVTPFGEHGQLDEAGFAQLIEYAASRGVKVFTPNGNTSEFYSLDAQERQRTVELTLKAAPEALVVAGVGGDVRTAVRDAQLYRELGVESVMVHQPVHPFWSRAGWVTYHEQICEAVPDIAVVPYVRNARVTTEAIRELLTVGPNVVAVKYAIADPVAFAAMVRSIGPDRVSWVCGLAEMWAPFFAAAGAVGFTSGLVSIDPDRSLRMLDQLARGDYAAAMAEWAEIQEFEALRARDASEMNVSAVKEALAQIGACRRDVRPPLSLLEQSDRATVTKIVQAWGLAPQTPHQEMQSQG